MFDLLVLAADEIPPTEPLAQLAVPLGVLIFLGSIYLLLRSNLGTARGYYVFGTSLFGFLFLISLFWGFGAPGTPQATGPTNLPGQPADALQAKWIPFAQDSRLADRSDLAVVKSHPEGFTEDGWPEDEQENIELGISEALNFFSSEAAGQVIAATATAQTVSYARTDTGFPLIAIEFAPDDGGEPDLAVSYFDAGSPLLPSIIVMVASLVLFVLHAFLLDRSEVRERRELEAARAAAAGETERVPAGV